LPAGFIGSRLFLGSVESRFTLGAPFSFDIGRETTNERVLFGLHSAKPGCYLTVYQRATASSLG
jgi:hypothetical protein